MVFLRGNNNFLHFKLYLFIQSINYLFIQSINILQQTAKWVVKLLIKIVVTDTLLQCKTLVR